jgi:hypothetical protein
VSSRASSRCWEKSGGSVPSADRSVMQVRLHARRVYRQTPHTALTRWWESRRASTPERRDGSAHISGWAKASSLCKGSDRCRWIRSLRTWWRDQSRLTVTIIIFVAHHEVWVGRHRKYHRRAAIHRQHQAMHDRLLRETAGKLNFLRTSSAQFLSALWRSHSGTGERFSSSCGKFARPLGESSQTLEMSPDGQYIFLSDRSQG